MPPCETATFNDARRASQTRSGSATKNWRANHFLLRIEISTSGPRSREPTTTMALGLRRTKVRFGLDPCTGSKARSDGTEFPKRQSCGTSAVSRVPLTLRKLRIAATIPPFPPPALRLRLIAVSCGRTRCSRYRGVAQDRSSHIQAAARVGRGAASWAAYRTRSLSSENRPVNLIHRRPFNSSAPRSSSSIEGDGWPPRGSLKTSGAKRCSSRRVWTSFQK
jgi:hypothetical protein